MSVNFWRHQRIRIWRKLDLNLRWAKISLNLWRITWQSQKRPLFILSIYSLQCTRNNRRLKQKKKKTVADKAGKLTTNTDNYLVDHKINPQHISRENVAVNLWRNTVDPSPGVNNRDCYHSSEPDFAPELMYASHSNDLYFAGRRTMQIFRCRFTSRIVSASFPSHFFTFSIPPTSTCRLLCYSFFFFLLTALYYVFGFHQRESSQRGARIRIFFLRQREPFQMFRRPALSTVPFLSSFFFSHCFFYINFILLHLSFFKNYYYYFFFFLELQSSSKAVFSFFSFLWF